MNSARIVVHEAVRAALHEKRAVVALESTIITHGLPHPINYKTAVAAEDAIRRVGAEPATIALIDGVAHVGLDCSQLARVAESGPRCTFKSQLFWLVDVGMSVAQRSVEQWPLRGKQVFPFLQRVVLAGCIVALKLQWIYLRT